MKIKRVLLGYFTISDLAEVLNVSVPTVHRWVRLEKLLPAPTKTIGAGRREYYDADDLRQIKKIVAKW